MAMMWRLNFLVAVTCVVLQNSYMLYYICPMHTLFTIMVYAALGIAPQYNQSHTGILIKCAWLSSCCMRSMRGWVVCRPVSSFADIRTARKVTAVLGAIARCAVSWPCRGGPCQCQVTMQCRFSGLLPHVQMECKYLECL